VIGGSTNLLSGNGGASTLAGGDGAVNGGSVYIYGGSGSGTAGSVTIFGGTGSGGSKGDVSINSNLTVQKTAIKSYVNLDSVVDDAADRGVPRFSVTNTRDSDDRQLIDLYVTNLTSRASNHGNVYVYTKPGTFGAGYVLALNAYWDFGMAKWSYDKSDPDGGTQPSFLITSTSRVGIVQRFARDTDGGDPLWLDNGHAAVMAKKSVNAATIDDFVCNYSDTDVGINPFYTSFGYVVTEVAGPSPTWKCHVKFNCSYCTVAASGAVTSIAFAIRRRNRTFGGTWSAWVTVPGSRRVIPAALMHTNTFQIPEISASTTIPYNGTLAQEVEFMVVMADVTVGSGSVTLSWPNNGGGYFEVEINAYAGASVEVG